MMNKTETKFKQYCDKKKYFCRKLHTHTATGQGTNQVSDFYVANNNGVYFVECKERQGKSFELDGLTQFADLLLLNSRSNKAKIKILINFYDINKVIFIDFTDYINIIKGLTFKNGKSKKSINVNDFNINNVFTWKTLKF